MKEKYSYTLWGVIIMCLVFITACGGGGGSADTSAGGTGLTGATGSALPDIIDAYTDSFFKYADPSIYQHQYMKADAVLSGAGVDMNNPAFSAWKDTCTGFLGTLSDVIEVTQASTSQLTVLDKGTEFVYPIVSVEIPIDAWGYLVETDEFNEGSALKTGLLELSDGVVTLDALEYTFTVNADKTNCQATYIYYSDYDFSGVSIK